jgi:hypothetical protein
MIMRKMTVSIAGQGEYKTSPTDLDLIINYYASYPLADLHKEIQSVACDPGFEVYDLTTRIQALMVLAELRNYASVI